MPQVNKPSYGNVSTLCKDMDLTTQRTRTEIIKGITCVVQDGEKKWKWRVKSFPMALGGD